MIETLRRSVEEDACGFGAEAGAEGAGDGGAAIAEIAPGGRGGAR